MDAVVKFTPLLALAFVVARIALRRPLPLWGHALSLLAFPIAIAIAFVVPNPFHAVDFRAFHETGRVVLAGGDPYAVADSPDFLPALNPPPALPLFAMFASMPFDVAWAMWATFNIAVLFLGVELARRVINRAEPARPIAFAAVAGLAGVIALSPGGRLGLLYGQLHAWELVTVTLAVGCLASSRPLMAGALLGLASFKPQTMLPFLVLILKPREWRAWLAMAVVGFGLTFLATPPGELLTRLREMNDRVARFGDVGGLNDYSYANPHSEDVFSVASLLYALGMRERGVIAATQMILIALMGVAIAAKVLRDRWSPAASASVVACASMLFLYHRSADLIVLALPLTYAVGRMDRPGVQRKWYVGAVLAMTASLFIYGNVQLALLESSWGMGAAGWFVRAFVVPYPIWASAVALGCLWRAADLDRRHPAARLTPSSVP